MDNKLTEEIERNRMDIGDINKLMMTEADLDPRLVPYVSDNDWGGKMIHHPLMVEIFYMEQMNALINARFEAKKKIVDKAEREGDWVSIFLHTERGYRLDAFNSVCKRMTDKEYWQHLGETWTDSENIWQNFDLWCELLTNDRPSPWEIMEKEDRVTLSKLPDDLTIYRGHTAVNQWGLSWTLDKDKATWFSTRFKKNGAKVTTLDITKGGIMAYFSCRGESEIVMVPKAIERYRNERTKSGR